VRLNRTLTRKLGSRGPRRHRVIVLVDHFGDHEVLIQVQTGVVLALRSDTGRFCRCVYVEWLDPPGVVDAGARVGGQNLRGRHDRLRRDPQPTGELLFGELSLHRGVGDE
jgi:hypothetical protein